MHSQSLGSLISMDINKARFVSQLLINYPVNHCGQASVKSLGFDENKNIFSAAALFNCAMSHSLGFGSFLDSA